MPAGNDGLARRGRGAAAVDAGGGGHRRCPGVSAVEAARAIHWLLNEAVTSGRNKGDGRTSVCDMNALCLLFFI